MNETKFTQTALGMYSVKQVGETGTKYILIEVPYDPETGEAGTPKEVYRDNREDTIDQFKIKAAKFFEGV